MHDSRSFIRAAAVALIAAWAIGSGLPQIYQFWHTYGKKATFSVAEDGTIAGIEPGSAAARAGLKNGARVAWRAISPTDRLKYIEGELAASPGDKLTFPIVDGNGVRTVSIPADPLPFTTSDAVLAALGLFGEVVFVLVGGWLVLIRPSPVTWAFFAFAAAWGPADYTFAMALLPPRLALVQQVVYNIASGAGAWGVLYFGLVFPSGAGGTRKQFLTRWSWLSWPIVVLLTSDSTPALYVMTGMVLRPLLVQIGFFATSLVLFGALAAMAHTYIVARGLDRQRIKWVLASFTLGAGSYGVLNGLLAFGLDVPTWIQETVFLSSIFLPIAVAYTIIVHRIFDVNFIVSRALVYGILTTLMIGTFALIDWFVGKVLAQTRLALVAEIGAAIGLGFWLSGLHAKVERFIDATLFRDRHIAEQRLGRVASAVVHVGSAEAVEDMLVSEPADAMGLASAAVFRVGEDGVWRRTAAVHWHPGDTAEFGPDDRLVALLRGEQSALRISETGWSRADLPQGAARPIVALPILVRHDLRAIALYGAHTSGESIDPDELKSIEKLATMSSAALDHIEALELRRQNELLARELAMYRPNAGPVTQ